jgi:hypothetical protein
MFALNPAQEPYLTDLAVKKTIDKVSAFGRNYFTFNQLYAGLHKIAKKKAGVRRYGTIAAAVIGSVVAAMAVAKLGMGWLVYLIVPGLALFVVWYVRRPVTVSHEKLTSAIKTYTTLHPPENLVDGRRFERAMSKEELKDELFGYAPERILIVQRDDMVDMLVMNHFHTDNKTVVLSASKYPSHVFSAVRKFLAKHPHIPVAVIHDASREGIRLKEKLQSDPSWNLQGKEINDLGLGLEDVKRMGEPIWVPATGRSRGRAPAARAEENMEQGMSVPVDYVAPAVMTGVLGMAVVGMMGLMSQDLLAEQARQATTGSGSGGGYG